MTLYNDDITGCTATWGTGKLVLYSTGTVQVPEKSADVCSDIIFTACGGCRRVSASMFPYVTPQ